MARARPFALVLACLLMGPVAVHAETRVAVAIGDDGCQPSSLEVPAGVVVFELTNVGSAVGEFEIVGADRIVDEVENLVPGFLAYLDTRLDGGTYELVCSNLRTPRGTLVVTGGPAPTAPPSRYVDEATLDTYRHEYGTWINQRAEALVIGVEAFAAAIEAGDLETARALYAPTRVPWEQIEPIAELFADLDLAIDAREDDFGGGPDDPAFAGFHRIERLLWVDRASGDLPTLARDLVTDVRDLQGRLAELSIRPRVMARGAGELIDEVAQSKLTGEEDRYSRTDLWSIDANLAGSRKVVDLLRPSLEQLDPASLGRIDEAFAAVSEVMDRYVDGEGFQPFGEITPEDLRQLQARMAGLAEALAPLPGVLGLEA